MELQKGFRFLESMAKENLLLRDRFIEPPFSVLDTKQGAWQDRKRAWLALGIKGEIGRDNTEGKNQWNNYHREAESSHKIELGGNSASIFDPVLTELMCEWFCPAGGNILDPFAGGSVRGIVSHYLGYHYDGIELRQEQVDSNREQAMNILPIDNQPQWYVGDSNNVLENQWLHKFDFILSCPPYADLEVYSDLPDDISNMPYNRFLDIYKSIIGKSLKLLKTGCYACFVVGDVRDKKDNYYNFVGNTKSSFIESGACLYNDAVLLNAINTASMRAGTHMRNLKLVKIHQNVLVFKKL